ncbi:ABC transporter substrate-binding protein [Colwellia psychrerythraea]|uniref:Solute-binding protein family 3/N-terminal domain-containing protein n=1 Tax=Colwellia psychrerythraea TaxID=28229 RepID=A0A099L301_COLPS|nr:ABC transporter substrate-binding protein [Colwellia psychrerythraea]KGJ97221.1 hypothetical protein GAB14E_1294 [Colwellia psychrerythraea]
MKNLIILLLLISAQCFAVTTVTTTGKQKPDDASHDYFIGLLRLALIETSEEYGYTVLQTVPYPGQERMLKLLALGEFYDVVWAGNSIIRESDLYKIPFPLFRGGLGWRGMIIRQQDKSKFSTFKTAKDLNALIACQGLHWPDADILERAGLAVARVGYFDAMLQMVELKRCDYLPLSIFEGQAELAAVKDSFPNLIFYQELIIQYPLTMHFFVKSSNNILAQRLTLGLQRLYESGSYERYMKNHPLTQHAFPLTKFKKSTVISLMNSNYTEHALAEYGLVWPGSK